MIFNLRGTDLLRVAEMTGLNCKTDGESYQNHCAFFSPRCFSAHLDRAPPAIRLWTVLSLFHILSQLSQRRSGNSPSTRSSLLTPHIHFLLQCPSAAHSLSLSHSMSIPPFIPRPKLSFQLDIFPSWKRPQPRFLHHVGVHLTQPSAELPVTLSRPYNG